MSHSAGGPQDSIYSMTSDKEEEREAPQTKKKQKSGRVMVIARKDIVKRGGRGGIMHLFEGHGGHVDEHNIALAAHEQFVGVWVKLQTVDSTFGRVWDQRVRRKRV